MAKTLQLVTQIFIFGQELRFFFHLPSVVNEANTILTDKLALISVEKVVS